MEIRMVKLGELTPYEKNPRKNDEAVPYVAASIREFGFKVPIVIDANNVIVCGHTRFKAAKELGMTEVPCIVADDLTEEQVKAFRLADNKVAEKAEWDFDLLGDEMLDIPDIDMSEFGFFADEFEFEEPKEIMEFEPVEADENAPVKAKRGDIWQLGEHRLMCGSSDDAKEFSMLMGGEKADCVFTDPPYGVAIGSKNEMLNSVQRSGRCTENIIADTLPPDELYKLLVGCMTNVRLNCKDDASYFVTSPQGGELGLMMMMMMMKDAGLEVRHMLIWKKNCATFSLGRLDYDYQHEPIFYTWTKSHHNYRNGNFRTTIWEIDKPRKCDIHPTMKPVELVANCFMDCTKVGDIVLDAFGGSGTTIIAAEQLGRKARVMELDPKYCDAIINRWEQMTGKEAVLING